jgi:dTDP-glucose 4,6-dehydratase
MTAAGSPTGTVIITGGAGFIGSNLVRHALACTAARIVVVDKLTYAGSLINLDDVLHEPRLAFIQADIADSTAMARLFGDCRPSAVLNLAAETHVDRSIDDPRAFVDANILGTFVLLESARRYLAGVGADMASTFRFVHVSTDEVYGTLGSSGLFSEETPYAPNSPYAASKASADHLVRAYFHTYRLPVIITNCSNNYGAYQYPEKLIPLMILNAVRGRPLPIYGDGGNVRDWLHVDDHCAALLLVLANGRPGEKYNIGGANERTNLEIVDCICDSVERLSPAKSNPAMQGISGYRALKTFVPDRPGHDRRYGIDASKIRRELGWTPRRSLDEGLGETARWYLAHRDWCDRIQADRYDGQRLGLPR